MKAKLIVKKEIYCDFGGRLLLGPKLVVLEERSVIIMIFGGRRGNKKIQVCSIFILSNRACPHKCHVSKSAVAF